MGYMVQLYRFWSTFNTRHNAKNTNHITIFRRFSTPLTRAPHILQASITRDNSP
jgi:hypothetical protein